MVSIKLKHFIIILIILIFLVSTIYIAEAKQKSSKSAKSTSKKSVNKKSNTAPTAQVVANKPINKIRVLAYTNQETSNALAKGCKVVRDAIELKALLCSEDVAVSLGLQPDPILHVLDTDANAQIRADLVQSSGNNGEGRKVAVLDTGYNYNHPELSSSYLGGYDFVNEDSDPIDDNGHGTMVAGIITADGIDPKAKGVAPAVGIVVGKVCSASGSCYGSDMVAAIYWAVNGPDFIPGTSDDFNVDAISISIGGFEYTTFCDTWYPQDTRAIKYARGRGVIVVVAAGNSGTAGVTNPGCISYSTTVGAVDDNDVIASFSSQGVAVDITAPGVGLYTPAGITGSGYGSGVGTSFSTPMVSGTIALIKKAHPEWRVEQVESALFNTAVDLGAPGKDIYYGWGRVDAYAAVNYQSAGAKMHISNMDMRVVKALKLAKATVSVVDANNAPVGTATVYGQWSGATSDSDSGATNQLGKVTFNSDKVAQIPAGTTFTFCVTNVDKTGYTYDSSANAGTCDSVTV